MRTMTMKRIKRASSLFEALRPSSSPTVRSLRSRIRSSRGVTLIEILIVLAIVGLIAGGVAVVAIPKYAESQKNQAKIDARTVHPVAEKYKLDHPGQCPTIEQLRAEKELSAASKITDPWDTPYAIRCTDEDLYVMSFGPDKKEGTADDIRIPDNAPVPAK